MGNLVIFVVGLLDNWLVKVTETFTDILNYYVLQTTANKFAVHEKVYVVSKYLKFFLCINRTLKNVASNTTAGYIIFRGDDVIMYIKNEVTAK